MNFYFGDWLFLHDGLTGWGGQHSKKSHRYIVVTERLGQVIVLARSTDQYNYEGLLHPAHDGKCNMPVCEINRDGRISSDPVRPIDARWLNNAHSCHEPSDEVLNWVWDNKPKSLRP